MTDNLDNLLTEVEAAAYLRVAPIQLQRLRRTGRITAIQVTPRKFAYTEQLLRDYLTGQTRRSSKATVQDDGGDHLATLDVSHLRSGRTDKLAVEDGPEQPATRSPAKPAKPRLRHPHTIVQLP